MAKVKVWNDNVHPHRERFRGDWIEIPAKSYIEMEWEDGVQFRGQFTGIAPIIPETGNPDPTRFKMIRVEAPSEPIFKDAPLVNHATGEVAATMGELRTILREFRDANPDRIVPDTGEGKTDQVASMQAQIDDLKALILSQNVEKRPVGRPKKEA